MDILVAFTRHADQGITYGRGETAFLGYSDADWLEIERHENYRRDTSS